ncbi:MAG TPA: ShlB/FhaC/HecB family hemolysin secretion/activation protein [Rhabdochlamydiaceae bacterium]|nr:ShlB/FhaC/HecB family hemolysin secretion/activation protein [Rhabdochlamydiaceae bacterium]
MLRKKNIIPSAKNKFIILGTSLLSIQGYAHTTTHNNPPSSNAGVLDRTIEKEYDAKPLPPKREIPFIEIDIPHEQLKLGGLHSVYVERIEVVGDPALSSRKLDRVLANYENTELTMSDISELCAKIRAYYVEQGYILARAYPPVQDIRNRTLIIEVLEGKVGKITVSGNKHYTEQFILSYFNKYIEKPLNYDDFLRSLMLINENTDLSVGAVFEKGSKPGRADVILKVKDSRPVHAYFNTNDYGVRFNTSQRTGLRIDYGNCLLEGATLSVAEVVGSPVKSLTFTDLRYNFPISRSGWSGELSYMYTRAKSRRNFEDFHRLRIRSTSQIAGGKVAYAIVRNRGISSDIYGTLEYKNVKDFVLEQTTADDRLRVASLGMDFGFGDGWRGNNFIDLVYHQGIPNIMDGSAPIDDDCSRKGAGGTFSIINLDFRRMQEFLKDFFWILNFSGQFSFNKLPVPEQFYIGGMDTVRGYPLAAALGDSGYYANFELRIPPPGKNVKIFGSKHRRLKDYLQFVAFVDNGLVMLKSDEFPLHKGYTSMTSAGLGVRIYGPWHLDASFDFGFPLNDSHKQHNYHWYWKINWSI